MGYRADEEDDDDPGESGLDDRELPDESDTNSSSTDTDVAGEGGSDTVPCPYCGRAVYESAELCPHCGSYILDDDLARSRRPLWVVVGVLVCLAIVLVAWVLSGG